MGQCQLNRVKYRNHRHVAGIDLGPVRFSMLVKFDEVWRSLEAEFGRDPR
jgi:hypothetical protein